MICEFRTPTRLPHLPALLVMADSFLDGKGLPIRSHVRFWAARALKQSWQALGSTYLISGTAFLC